MLPNARSIAAIAQGLPFPYDVEEVNVTDIGSLDHAARAVATWFAGGINDSDIGRLRADIGAYILYKTLENDVFNKRCKTLFAPVFEIENSDLRKIVAMLSTQFPVT
jgi:hypothetical protein